MGLLTTSLFPVGGSATGRKWCRPAHRTNCVAITGGNSCCVCVPSTATCFIIEMWGQGGGGAGACCCMNACVGGQGGSYAWVTCTTTNTLHTLCACACTCNCCTPQAGVHTGSPGQRSWVTDCSAPNCYMVAGGACGGSTCCNYNYMGSGVCGYSFTHNPAHSNLAIHCCCYGFNTQAWCYDGDSYDGPGTKNYFRVDRNMPFQQIQGTSITPGISCQCCTCFNFYVRGACGWSDPQQLTAYSDSVCYLNRPLATFCGQGWGRGGSAYAGGAGQCCDCSNNSSSQYGGMNGHAPGGGGSSASGTGNSGGCCLGSCGGLGLILISWS